MTSRLRRLLASIAGLPQWVQAWLVVLVGTNLASLAFLDTNVGLWTAAAIVVVGTLNLPMMVIQGGLTRLLSLPHFVWFPLIVLLYGQLHGTNALPAGSPVRIFALAVLIVNGISLLFDVLEVYRWFRGEREVLGLDRSEPVSRRA